MHLFRLGISFEGDIVENNTSRRFRKLTYLIEGELFAKSYELMQTLEFDSDRKRMTVIIKSSDSDEHGKSKYLVYTKGADTSMFKTAKVMRSRDGNISTEGQQQQAYFDASLKEFSEKGWRTLILGFKVISQSEYDAYERSIEEARNDIMNRDTRLASCYEDIESNLRLIGVTAVEDKLQEDVELTLSALREAGIKIWVLTGDKLETAVNISESCRHFSTRMRRYTMANIRNSDQIRESIDRIKNE